LGRIEVEVGRVSLGPSELDHLVCARLGQVSGQVDTQATELGEVIALVDMFTGAVVQPEFRRELFLLTMKIGQGFSGLQVDE
jgi:hypothetical protein